MLKNYVAIAHNGTHEIEIKKSRFICYLARIKDSAEADAILTQIKKEHYKANHHCSAYVLGDHDDIQHSRDDGEPSGTAGAPMLNVLQRQHLTNTLAVTTRYFGGIKLGAGGLIRAYSHSVSEATAAIGLVQGTLQQELQVQIAYKQQGALEHYLEANHITVADTAYTVNVSLIILIASEQVETTKMAITNLLSGQVAFKLGHTRYHEVPFKQ
ncbi:YigZ family protein [Loigolactobacillus backii]|uniref:YigZ family protein n=1 Tax=Loigolactobacillus backii TaxID=375175 RepID=UPI000C1C8672|nr:YigZ family protein [Loigolactobacillus backii]PIO83907.1 YigZ family protein [Loigolactobacillus backii]